MTYCYNCDVLLSEKNKTIEHIIPNSIGGRLRSSELICKNCNSIFGLTLDAEVAKQFENLCAFLNIERDRPKDYIIKNTKTDSGEVFHLINGRNPTLVKPKITVTEQGINVTARDRKHAKQILNGLKRKYKNLDVTGAKFQDNKHFFEEDLNVDFSVGGNIFLQGIAKIVINVFLHFKKDYSKHLKNLIQILKQETQNQNHIHFYFIPDAYQWKEDEVVHYIQIKACEKKKILYSYVVLFSAYAFIINIDDNYEGSSWDCHYSFDLISQSTTTTHIEIDYGGRSNFINEIEDDSFNKGINEKILTSVQKYLNRLMVIGTQRHKEHTINEIVDDAIQEAFGENVPDYLTPELSAVLLNKLAPKLIDFLIHIRK